MATTKKKTKSKTKAKTQALTVQDVQQLQTQYSSELDANPEYALIADPTGALQMSDIQKEFIRHYVNFKNISAAAELACIDADTAKAIFVDYNTQQEIRRINRALYHRQFASKLITVDEIGGYLSSLLTGDNLPLADQLKSTEKLRVVELLLRLNELKRDSMDDPSSLLHSNIEAQLKNLSVQTIQQLLIQMKSGEVVAAQKKSEVVAKFDDGSLSAEEKSYLSTLPVEELLSLIEMTNKGGNSNDVQ